MSRTLYHKASAVVQLKQRDQFGAAVCTWWAGQNLLDVAPYIADARALQLALLGGKTGAEVEGTYWEYLLTQMGWLRFDRALGPLDTSAGCDDDDRRPDLGRNLPCERSRRAAGTTGRLSCDAAQHLAAARAGGGGTIGLSLHVSVRCE